MPFTRVRADVGDYVEAVGVKIDGSGHCTPYADGILSVVDYHRAAGDYIGVGKHGVIQFDRYVAYAVFQRYDKRFGAVIGGGESVRERLSVKNAV